MAKGKNFKINRNKTPPVLAGHIEVGDMFEKDGSLHMRVLPSTVKVDDGVWICNLNTGGVWPVESDTLLNNISACEINYKVF